MLPPIILESLAVLTLFTTIGRFLEDARSEEQKREFVRKLNIRLRQNGQSSADGVFKIVFDYMDSLRSRIFGLKLFSMRSILVSFAITTFFLTINIMVWRWILPQEQGILTTLFNSSLSILVFFVIFFFSLFANFLSIVQTRFFLEIFRTYPTGGRFIILVYCNIIPIFTIFILTLTPAIVLSLFIVDREFHKIIPLQVGFGKKTTYPYQSSVDQNEISFRLMYVENDTYKRYDMPVMDDMSVRWVVHGQSTSALSADEFLESHFHNFKNIKVIKLEQEKFWPINCSQETEISRKCYTYNYIIHVYPILSFWYLGDLIALSANTLSSTIVHTPYYLRFGSYFALRPENIYYLFYPFLEKDIGNILAKIVIESNPHINVHTPLTPFFLTILMISLFIFVLAFGFKLNMLTYKLLNWLLGGMRFWISEREPYMSLCIFFWIVAILFSLLFKAVTHII
jgi:hypothetical protein